MRRKALAATGVLAALLLGAGAAPGVATTTAASTVSVVIKEWSLKASAVTVPAGKTTFVVRNAGTMKHEFLVIRSDRHHHQLQVKGGRASEAGERGEIERIAPGATRRLTLTLPAGKYVLLCNLPGHYKRGQYASLTAKAAAVPRSTTVKVSAFEMGFKLSQTTVPVGTVTFEVTNDGKLPHDFTFGSRGGGTRILEAGESATHVVTFAKPGQYIYICTVEGHQAAGMRGVLTVR